MAEKRRSLAYEELLEPFPIEDLANVAQDTTPVMIEEIYQKDEEDCEEKSYKPRETKRFNPEEDGYHLFVLVHGFQATHVDVQEVKNHIAMVVSNAIFLCSSSNERQKTEGDIELMGERLADEVHEFFDEDDEISEMIYKITFVGHSMGGIIIR